jgi:hypothetical protein
VSAVRSVGAHERDKECECFPKVDASGGGEGHLQVEIDDPASVQSRMFALEQGDRAPSPGHGS